MRSIPAGLAWEMTARGLRDLLQGVIGSVLYTYLLFHFLFDIHGLDLTEPSVLYLCRILVGMMLLCISIPAIAAQGAPSRLFAYPVRNSTIVASHLLAAIISTSLGLACCIVIINRLFPVAIPLWGPVLAVITVVPSCQVAVWLTEKTYWLPLALVPIGVFIGGWYHWRINSAAEIWPEVTVFDFITGMTVVTACYFLGIFAVARNRHGDWLNSLGQLDWLQDLNQSLFERRSGFKTRLQAQFWFEWQNRGWNLPIVVFTIQFAGYVIWLLFDRSSQGVTGAYLFFGFILSLIGFMCGLLWGGSDPYVRKGQMNQFLASSPITNKDLGNVLLKSIAKSVLIGWSLWAIGFGVSLTTLLLMGIKPPFPGWVRWWCLPAALIGCWSFTATMATCVASGNAILAYRFSCGLISQFVAMFAIQSLLPKQLALSINGGLLITDGVILVIVTLLVFLIAMNMQMISAKTVISAAVGWIAIAAIVLSESSKMDTANLFSRILCLCATSLVVFPLAAAPLAMASNRTR